MTLPLPQSRVPSRIRGAIAALATAALGATLLTAPAALAQNEPRDEQTVEPAESAAPSAEAGDSPDDRATSFRNVRGAQSEDVPGGNLLIGAYGAIAVLLLIFLLRQQRMIAAGEARLRDLEAQLGASTKEAEPETTGDEP